MIMKLVDLGYLTHFTPFQANPNQLKWVTKWVALQNNLCILTQIKNRKNRDTRFYSDIPKLFISLITIPLQLHIEIITCPIRCSGNSCCKDFTVIRPASIEKNKEALAEFDTAVDNLRKSLEALKALGVPNEDVANLLPLGMTTKCIDELGCITF